MDAADDDDDDDDGCSDSNHLIFLDRPLIVLGLVPGCAPGCRRFDGCDGVFSCFPTSKRDLARTYPQLYCPEALCNLKRIMPEVRQNSTWDPQCRATKPVTIQMLQP